MKLLSQEAALQVKQLGKNNDMIDMILNTSYFAPVHGKLKQLLDPATFIGRAPQQVSHIVKTLITLVRTFLFYRWTNFLLRR